MTMYVDELLDLLDELNIDPSEVNIQMEPSTSKDKLKELENKYNINNSLSVIELSIDEAISQYGISHDDFIDWCNEYENVIYFEKDSDKD